MRGWLSEQFPSNETDDGGAEEERAEAAEEVPEDAPGKVLRRQGDDVLAVLGMKNGQSSLESKRMHLKAHLGETTGGHVLRELGEV